MNKHNIILNVIFVERSCSELKKIQENSLRELIGKNLKKIRERNEMTQDELSDISGVDRSMISKMENGMVFPSMKVFLSLCIGLKITLDTLLEGWEDVI